MRRPAGFLVLAVIMGWLACAGLAHAAVMLSPAGYGGPLLAVFALLYSVTAAVAAVGFLRVSRWALRAYQAWIAAVVLTLILITLTVPFPAAPSPAPARVLPWWMGVLLVGGVAIVLSLPIPYIRRRLPD